MEHVRGRIPGKTIQLDFNQVLDLTNDVSSEHLKNDKTGSHKLISVQNVVLQDI